MDNPPAYGARRLDPNRFFHDVMEEALFAMERFAREGMPACAGT
jgi:hypothetical protein